MAKVTVEAPYPCWVTITLDNEQVIRCSHADLLELEHAVAEAKHKALCKLDRRDWHEIDPKLAAP